MSEGFEGVGPAVATQVAWAVLLLATGCSRPFVDTGQTGQTADTGAVHHLQLVVDTRVALPFATAGDPVPAGSIAVADAGEAGSTGSLEVEVTGDFAVSGDLAALEPGESRALLVEYTGSTDLPTLVDGRAVISADGQSVEVELTAVLGDPALPVVDWQDDDWSLRAVAPMPSAPFPDGSAGWTDASVLLAVPHGLSDADGVHAVTHLHGHNAVLDDMLEDKALVELASASGRDAVLVVPQGPVAAASGDFGKLDDPGGHQRLVRDVISLLYRDALIAFPAPGLQVLSSHSGGYRATARVVEHGGLPIRAVHLFDSLYAEASTFEAFARSGGVLRSSYTTSGGTQDDNLLLATALADLAPGTGFTDPELVAHDVIIGDTTSSHGQCMTDGREYARWLVHSGLPPHPLAPPELVRVLASGATTEVQWMVDRGSVGREVVVQGSWDGSDWEDLATSTGASAEIPGRPWVRAVAHDEGLRSEPSDGYGGTGSEWLVVDGFDRFLGGSWTRPTHSFAARVGSALGRSFSTASNEAVATGEVGLGDFDRVLWLLGDESLADQTFDETERSAVDAFVDGGGGLIVSGAEVGYATPAGWLSSTLHATYVADDAGTVRAGGYTFGVAYPEDYPDVLSGETTLWTYDSGGAAAVGWQGRVVVVGFPLETLADADLAPALAELVGWLDG